MFHLIKEGKIEIDSTVAWAVERTDCRGGGTAGGLHSSAKEHHPWVFVPRAEEFPPGRFRVGEDDGRKPTELILGGSDGSWF